MNIYYSYLKWRGFFRDGRRPSTKEIQTQIALRRRAQLTGTKFIGITGSGGKTTAARLLHHMLSEQNICALSAFENTIKTIPKRISRLSKDTSYAVFEISGHEPGAIDASCTFVKPQVGIVTIVSSDHFTNFRGVENTVQEKGCLVENIPREGMVFLNADDAQVLAMRGRAKAQVFTYGKADGADYRATDLAVTSQGRLQFKCHYHSQVVPFEIGLFGLHFIIPVLAAVSCAHQFGIPLLSLAERARTFVQTPGRCSLHSNENGPVFICDTTKAPFQTIHLALELIEYFPLAPRRTIVLGTISDKRGSISKRYVSTYEAARELAERIVLFGKGASHAKPDQADLQEGRAVFVDDIRALRDLIKETQIPGEIILLKGSGAVDHLERVAMDYQKNINCWSSDCRLAIACFTCKKA